MGLKIDIYGKTKLCLSYKANAEFRHRFVRTPYKVITVMEIKELVRLCKYIIHCSWMGNSEKAPGKIYKSKNGC